MGGDFNEHARCLDFAHEQNQIRVFQQYTRRRATGSEVRIALSLTFRELYHTEQLRRGFPGPLFLYSASRILLFLRVYGDHKLRKWLCFERFLPCLQTTLGFCFHLADLCCHLSAYQVNVRALCTIKTVLKLNHLRLANRFTIRTLSAYDSTAIRRSIIHAGQL